MKSLPYDKPHFLEPAHDHDPADVSNLTDLPLSISASLPNEIREVLPAMREATSIVFASFNRLNDLLSQRLERLSVLQGENRKTGARDVQYSEPAYFTYQNQVMTEAQYLLGEALPDWKHKATRVEHASCRRGIMLDPEIAQTGSRAKFVRWFASLKDDVQEWKRIAEGVEVPDFEQAVADLTAIKVTKKGASVHGTPLDVKLNGKPIRKIEKVDSGIDL